MADAVVARTDRQRADVRGPRPKRREGHRGLHVQLVHRVLDVRQTDCEFDRRQVRRTAHRVVAIADQRSVLVLGEHQRVQRLARVRTQGIHELHGTGVHVEQVDFFRQLDSVTVLRHRFGDVGNRRGDQGPAKQEGRVALKLTQRCSRCGQVVDTLPLNRSTPAVLVQLTGERAVKVREFLARCLKETLHQHEVDGGRDVCCKCCDLRCHDLTFHGDEPSNRQRPPCSIWKKIPARPIQTTRLPARLSLSSPFVVERVSRRVET